MSILYTQDLGLPKFSNCADLEIGTRTIFCHSISIQPSALPSLQKENRCCLRLNTGGTTSCERVCVCEVSRLNWVCEEWPRRCDLESRGHIWVSSSATASTPEDQCVPAACWAKRLCCGLPGVEKDSIISVATQMVGYLQPSLLTLQPSLLSTHCLHPFLFWSFVVFFSQSNHHHMY